MVTNDAARTAPLTAETLRAAIDKLDEQHRRRSVDCAERLERFMLSIPAELRRHRIVTIVAHYISTDTPMHPDDWRRYSTQLDEPPAEHERRQPVDTEFGKAVLL
jgi:hypothetical protein